MWEKKRENNDKPPTFSHIFSHNPHLLSYEDFEDSESLFTNSILVEKKWVICLFFHSFFPGSVDFEDSESLFYNSILVEKKWVICLFFHSFFPLYMKLMEKSIWKMILFGWIILNRKTILKRESFSSIVLTIRKLSLFSVLKIILVNIKQINKKQSF